MKEFPILYKKNRFWKIWVEDLNNKALIYTSFGIINGKITTPSPTIIDKKIGKKSFFERAIKLAETKWNNKIITNNYKTDKNFNNNFLIDFTPMKPTNYEKSKNKIIFPAYLQPKLDGYRAIVYCKNNKLFIVSRQGKEHKHLEFLSDELKKNKIICEEGMIIDGELVGENMDIRELKSILGRDEYNEKVKKINYYIYDCFITNKPNLIYKDRFKLLENIKGNHIHITPTEIINNENELNKRINEFKEKGFEGGMLRNMNGIYKQVSSSYNLQKIKFYYIDKFKIVGFKEGSGDDKETVIWQVKCLKGNKTFFVKPKGTREERKLWFKDADKYIGKYLNIEYFEKDKDGCVMRIKTGFF